MLFLFTAAFFSNICAQCPRIFNKGGIEIKMSVSGVLKHLPFPKRPEKKASEA